MKYCVLIILFLVTSAAQASYCSGKNWQNAYQFYTNNIDLLNEQIDRYNILLNKFHLLESGEDKQQYLVATLAIEELDQLSIDVESLEGKFSKVNQLWLLISEGCLNDDELDYSRKATENIRGGNIGSQEVNDLLTRIASLRLRFFQVAEFTLH